MVVPRSCMSILGLVVLLSGACVLSSPLSIGSNTDVSTESPSSDSQFPRKVFKTFEEVTHFLRSWFGRLRAARQETETSSLESDSAESDHQVARQRREVKTTTTTDDPAFEDYEKQFLIAKTLSYLRQMYMYAEFKNNSRQMSQKVGGVSAEPTATPDGNAEGATTTTDPDNGSRVPAILEQKRTQLENMSNEQLADIFRNVQRAAVQGFEDINAALSSLCCPYG